MTSAIDQSSAAVVDAALVAGVVEIIKRAGLPSTYGGAVALLFGVGVGFARYGFSTASLLYGIAVGLAASGIYETSKNISKAKGPTA